MRKRFDILMIIGITVVSLIGCVTSLQNFEPNTPDEMKIKTLLISWETMWNNHDVDGTLALYNEQARIMYGKDRRMATKAEYGKMLPDRIKAHPSVKLGPPRINVTGNKADVSISLSIGSRKTQAFLNLIMKNGTWSIMSWKY